MIEQENLRFMEVVEKLKERGLLADYVELAGFLGTNKAGISDIKQGRKKVSIEALRRMKNSYRQIDINYIVMGEGTPFCEDIPQSSIISSISPVEESFLCRMYEKKDEENKTLNAIITKMAEELGSLKNQLTTYQHQSGELEKDPEGLDCGKSVKDAFIKNPLSIKTPSANTGNAPLSK